MARRRHGQVRALLMFAIKLTLSATSVGTDAFSTDSSRLTSLCDLSPSSSSSSSSSSSPSPCPAPLALSEGRLVLTVYSKPSELSSSSSSSSSLRSSTARKLRGRLPVAKRYGSCCGKGIASRLEASSLSADMLRSSLPLCSSRLDSSSPECMEEDSPAPSTASGTSRRPSGGGVSGLRSVSSSASGPSPAPRPATTRLSLSRLLVASCWMTAGWLSVASTGKVPSLSAVCRVPLPSLACGAGC
mmetsp:Transcript_5929/g.22997  ORF Transcript_5929/g.22997 Transcript_5929/m.22997 type:complete len:244 (+) Transcript_5929:1428-2159(+)